MMDTAPGALLHYARSGGRKPSDDESMAIWSDRFEARRSVGGARIGSFAGQFAPTVVRRLQAAVDAVTDTDDVLLPTPMDGATETIALENGRSASLGSNEQLDGPWGALLRLIRELIDGTALEFPVAAVSLAVSTSAARLDHLGERSLELDVSSIAVRVVRVDSDGLVLARWQTATVTSGSEDSRRSGPPRSWMESAPGWSQELPFDHGMELSEGEYLRCWVTLDIRDDGRARTGRLFVAVPALTDGG